MYFRASLHLSESREERIRLEAAGDEIEAFDELGKYFEGSCKAAVDDEEEGDVLLVCEEMGHFSYEQTKVKEKKLTVAGNRSEEELVNHVLSTEVEIKSA